VEKLGPIRPAKGDALFVPFEIACRQESNFLFAIPGKSDQGDDKLCDSDD